MSENQRDDESRIPQDAEFVPLQPNVSVSRELPDSKTVQDFRSDGKSSDSVHHEPSCPSEGELADAKTATSLGDLLRNERIRQGLSLGEVARRLCLSEQQVSAIEAQSYDSLPLPSTTFLRGYVRNYARLLRLANVDQLLQTLPRSLPAKTRAEGGLARGMQPVRLLSEHRRGSSVSGKWLYFLLTVGVLLIGYLLFQSDKLDQESSALPGDLDLPSLPESASTDKQTAIELSLPAVIPPSLSTESPSALLSTTEPNQVKNALAGIKPSIDRPAEPAAVTEEHQAVKSLHFVFSRDSWVKVKDGEGKVILEKIHARGSENTVRGKPPLYLVIGNAAGVTLTYDGRKVDLAPYTRGSDDVARFSLE